MDARARKAQSEGVLRAYGVPINPALPVIEEGAAITLRTSDEIVDRLLALCWVTAKGEGMDSAGLERLSARYAITSKLSPQEAQFAAETNPDPQACVNATWRYESVAVLLWALGFLDDLPFPRQMFTAADLVRIVAPHSESELRGRARPRSSESILDQADLIYRIHWACVDARIHHQPAPAQLEPDVVYERHYALNWLIQDGDQDWDHVLTNT
jgi:hypothetical protein